MKKLLVEPFKKKIGLCGITGNILATKEIKQEFVRKKKKKC